MRWRLQNILGYEKSYGFTMKNTGGQDIYDMIFATDHPAGDKIMRHLYGRALGEHETMRRHALLQRRDRRQEKAGVQGLFDVSPEMTAGIDVQASTVYEPESPHPPYTLG